MAKLTLQGAQELRARLNAITLISAPILADWADDATKRMRQKIYSPTGKMRESLHGYYSETTGEVWADWHVTFIDKGRAESVGQRSPQKTLKFYGSGAYSGRTMFAKRAGSVRKRPFIRASANAALRADPMAKELIAAWNEAGRGIRGVKGEKVILGNKTYAKRKSIPRYARAI